MEHFASLFFLIHNEWQWCLPCVNSKLTCTNRFLAIGLLSNSSQRWAYVDFKCNYFGFGKHVFNRQHCDFTKKTPLSFAISGYITKWQKEFKWMSIREELITLVVMQHFQLSTKISLFPIPLMRSLREKSRISEKTNKQTNKQKTKKPKKHST